jgi:hypothetical protein
MKTYFTRSRGQGGGKSAASRTYGERARAFVATETSPRASEDAGDAPDRPGVERDPHSPGRPKPDKKAPGKRPQGRPPVPQKLPGR